MQPIPVGLGSKASEISELPDKKETEGKDEEDSITAEIAELRTPDPTQKSAEWVRVLLFPICYLLILFIIALC